MESIIRNVGEINTDERRLYESVLGRALRENQQVIIRVVEMDMEPDDVGRKVTLGRAVEIARQGCSAASAQGVTEEAAGEAIDEAIQEVRRWNK